MRTSYNTNVEFTPSTIVKTTLRTYKPAFAQKLINDTHKYYGDLAQEPIDVPELLDIHTLPTENGNVAVQTISALDNNPNLQTIPGADRMLALELTLAKIADMRTYEGSKLHTPMDAIGPNFHVNIDDESLVLVDTFPPIPRDARGRIPYENIQFTNVPGRRAYIDFYRGTRPGVMMHTLASVAFGYSPARQVAATVQHSHQELHDVIPQNLPVAESTFLHNEIDRNFKSYVRYWTVSDALCFAALQAENLRSKLSR